MGHSVHLSKKEFIANSCEFSGSKRVEGSSGPKENLSILKDNAQSLYQSFKYVSESYRAEFKRWQSVGIQLPEEVAPGFEPLSHVGYRKPVVEWFPSNLSDESLLEGKLGFLMIFFNLKWNE
jgi:hypothetical protein